YYEVKMIGIRHEKYESFNYELPFSLGIDLVRTVYNCSKEQNWHENIEIELFTDGEGTVLLDGEKYSVKKGDIIVVNSNVVHYTTTDNYLKYTCLIIGSSWCRQMGIDHTKLQFSPFIKSDYLKENIEKLVNIYTDCTTFLKIALSNEILLKIMIKLCKNYSKTETFKELKNRKFDVIKSTVTYIHKNFNQKLTLSEISKEVLMDKYALCKEFKKYTGQTIFEYLNQYRSIRAIDYLKDGFNVAETASMCGFENLSFFTRTFKRYTRKTPSYYKNL
ncbi:MAG: AraC family transcriptional regulator, partial [Clostridia bacterium]|nr:AraC family transcriptional regulator [Clostridia bacterium]